MRYTYMPVIMSFIVLGYFSFGVNNIPAINIYCVFTTCQHNLRKLMAVKGFFFNWIFWNRPFYPLEETGYLLNLFFFYSICSLFVIEKIFVGNKLSKTWGLTPWNILALFCVLFRMRCGIMTVDRDLDSPTSQPLFQEAFALLFWTRLHAFRLIPALALGQLQGSCLLSTLFSMFC